MALAVGKNAENLYFAFANNPQLEYVGSDDAKMESSKATNTSYMFFRDKGLKNIIGTNLIADNNVDVQGMFRECITLNKIALNDGTD